MIDDFRGIEKRILIISLIFSGLVAIISLFVPAAGGVFVLGVIAGTVLMLFNLHILGIAADLYFNKGETGMAILCYIFRVFLYGLAAICCFKLGNTQLVTGLVAGIMGLFPGALSSIGMGSRSGSSDK